MTPALQLRYIWFMELEIFAPAPENLPIEEKIEIPSGVNPESIDATVKSIKSQMEYYWETLSEEVPEVKVDVLKEDESSILVRISAEASTSSTN